MNPQPPTQIGKYRIERELGRGTMGVVYQAKDTTLGRTVALKTFGAASTMAAHEREAFEQRFLSEARISATLEDPHVVGVYDVGRDFESGLLYMALEYVRGETLADRLARGPMPWKEAARIVAKIARALEIAHANGIVHRDVKPANIMLTAAGEPKVMDFGIAKASAVQLTLAGQVFGTPAYMSPEQASGERVDGRSDIFSLGCVLQELVTGARPFEGSTMAATITKILNDDPKPASSLMTGVPHALDSIVARATRKSRDGRYLSAAEMAADLDRMVNGVPGTVEMAAAKAEADSEAELIVAAPPPGGPGTLETAPLLPPPTVALPVSVDTASLTPVKPARPSGTSTNAPRPSGRPSSPVSPSTHPPAPSNSTRMVIGAALAIAVLGGGFLLLKRTDSPARVPDPMPAAEENTSEATPDAPAPTRQTPRTEAGAPTTATELSMGRGGATSRVTLALQHPFGSGSLRIKVDERIIVATSIQGMPMRRDGEATGYDGRFSTDFNIPAGTHTVLVEVRSGETVLSESVSVRTAGGETRRIVANAGATLTLRVE